MFDKFLCKHIHKRTIRVRDIVNKVFSELKSVLLLLVGVSSILGMGAAISLIIGETYYALNGYTEIEMFNEFGIIGVAFTGLKILPVPVMGVVLIYIAAKGINRVLDIEVAQCPLNDDDETKGVE